MDATGVAGIQQRIAQIEARFTVPASRSPAPSNVHVSSTVSPAGTDTALASSCGSVTSPSAAISDIFSWAASSPMTKSCGTSPVLLTENVTVSPAATVTSAGSKPWLPVRISIVRSAAGDAR
jgi:hypothetical protein